MPTPNADVLSMSDEEFAKLATPVAAPSSETDAPEADAKEGEASEKPVEEAKNEPVEKPEVPAEGAEAPGSDEPAEEEAPAEVEPAPLLKDPDDKSPAPAPAEGEKLAEPKAEEEEEKPKKKEEEEKPATKPKDAAKYEAFYEQVMAPFKANGKMIQLQDAAEVVQLLQMGANYTKKMQAIQPHKKLLMMLEQNGIDENKLSFYIDLDKKNPDAIKKLLKDAKIDPVDLDVSGEVQYKAGTHAVSDREASLQTVIEDLSLVEGGRETLQAINTEWDQASKSQLMGNPELLHAIHAQRQSGVYNLITAEVERRKTLGQLPVNAEFLKAYKFVGDELAAKNALRPGTSAAPQARQPVAVRTPVAVRPVRTTDTKAANAQRARAAAPTRSTSTPAKPSVNVLAMSDEEFLKFTKRV